MTRKKKKQSTVVCAIVALESTIVNNNNLVQHGMMGTGAIKMADKRRKNCPTNQRQSFSRLVSS